MQLLVEAKTEQLLAAYEKTVLNALAEVENALVAFKQEQVRRDLLQTAAEAAQQSVDLVETQYIEGLIGFQSYLDAQRVLFSQQDLLAVSMGLVFTNVINLNRALGGGWSLDDPDPDLVMEQNEQSAANEKAAATHESDAEGNADQPDEGEEVDR